MYIKIYLPRLNFANFSSSLIVFTPFPPIIPNVNELHIASHNFNKFSIKMTTVTKIIK